MLSQKQSEVQDCNHQQLQFTNAHSSKIWKWHI